jgi:predicted metal-dependent peptidase
LVACYPGYGDLATAFPWTTEKLPPGVWAATDGDRLLFSPSATDLPPRKFLWLVAHELMHILLHHTRPWTTAADVPRLRTAMEIEADQNVPSAFEPLSVDRDRLASSLKAKGVDTLPKIYCWLGEHPSSIESVDEVRISAHPEVVRAKVLTALSSGRLPGNLQDIIGSLSEPTVLWREELVQYVGTHVGQPCMQLDRLVPHYWAMGIPVPPMGRAPSSVDLVLALDSSGSMKGEPIRLCLSQFRGLRGLVDDVDVYVCDAAIQALVHLQEVSDDEIVLLTQAVKGYGGTDFRPVFEAVEKLERQPQLLVYMTDADGQYPDRNPPYDVLWLTTTYRKPPFGRVLRIPATDLKEV